MTPTRGGEFTSGRTATPFRPLSFNSETRKIIVTRSVRSFVRVDDIKRYEINRGDIGKFQASISDASIPRGG